jgi:hypothetical protein
MQASNVLAGQVSVKLYRRESPAESGKKEAAQAAHA